VSATLTDDFARDTADMKLMEARLRFAERVVARVGLAAHNLNNALTPISLAVEALTTGSDETETRHILSILQTASGRAAGLVQQILSMADECGRPTKAGDPAIDAFNPLQAPTPSAHG
jgi:signal transduction histidine kinase